MWDHTGVKTYLGKSMGFPKYIQPNFFVGSSANWTLLNITTSTLHVFRYNSVIDFFSPGASFETILE